MLTPPGINEDILEYIEELADMDGVQVLDVIDAIREYGEPEVATLEGACALIVHLVRTGKWVPVAVSGPRFLPWNSDPEESASRIEREIGAVVRE